VLVHGGFALFEGFVALFTPIWLFLLVLVVSVFVHEGLHGIGWGVLGGAGWDAMKFGVKQMTPYAHCKIPLNAASYRVGAALPGLVLGVLPGVIGVIFGSGCHPVMPSGWVSTVTRVDRGATVSRASALDRDGSLVSVGSWPSALLPWNSAMARPVAIQPAGSGTDAIVLAIAFRTAR